MSEIFQNRNANEDDQQNSRAKARHAQNGEGFNRAQAGRREGQNSP
jgi:hypothetical protein